MISQATVKSGYSSYAMPNTSIPIKANPLSRMLLRSAMLGVR